ncbi:MAG: peptidase, partial [Hydrocarboniphaga sp.]|uniref:M13 family metallopeptidase n=1 Tax=Hydrocarboniphaga sp. TaxID=2033016 RepID=UPI002610DC56
MMKNLLAGACCVLLLAACGKKPAPAPAEPTAAPALSSGVDKANFDAGVRPQDDLYQAINGTWLKNTPIPVDRSNYGSFTKLADDAEAQLRVIIEELSTKTGKTPGSIQQKVGDYYASFMDEASIEAAGIKPAAPELARVDALKDKKDLPALMAELARNGVATPLFPYVHQDAKDSTQYAGDFYQAGLGLPDRDYYLIDDDKFKGIRAAYLAHMQKMFELAGLNDAAKTAKDVLALETQIAKVQWDKVENRDPVKTYNPYEPAKLATLTSEIDWAAYLPAVGYGSLKQVLVSQPTYVTGLGKLIKSTPIETWRSYFKWHVLHTRAGLLNKAIVDEDFAFNSKTLNGVQEIRPRWKRGVDGIETSMGEAVGQVYVERHFPAASKARMESLVKNLLKTYESAIGGLSWMSDETKKAALVKLSKFTYKIGYPNKWRDYSKLEISSGDVVGNSMRAAAFEYDRNTAKLGKPIDREEWGMTPQTVNAYYNPEMNEIVFPAAILQPPFFDANAEDAVNYGGIGAVIGHEISHGFDDQGAQYDGDGNLRDWWTPADHAQFAAKTQALVAEYSGFSLQPGYNVKGALTMGENIADNSGVAIAYKAYRISLNGKPAPVLDGYGGDQRFYLGFAQIWREKGRENFEIEMIKTDPHSPGPFRANGSVVNQPGFYA